MKTHESEEMYLETILLLREERGNVRAVDVAERLNYAKSSVSRAVNLLKERGYIVLDANGRILFTEAGEQTAKTVMERHTVLTAFLRALGASEELAEQDACRIEHVISAELFELIKRRVENRL